MPVDAVVLAVLFVASIVVALRLQRRHFVLQYLFFLRFPLLTAATIALLPIAASFRPLKALLGNLFVVRPWPAFVLTTVSALATFVVIYVGHFLFVWTPFRFGLSFSRWRNDRRLPNTIPAKLQSRIDRGLFAAIMLPCSIVLVARAPGPGLWLWNLLAVTLGVVAAAFLRRLATQFFPVLATENASRFARARSSVTAAYTTALNAPLKIVPKRVGDALGHGFHSLEEQAQEAEKSEHATSAAKSAERVHGRARAHGSDFAPLDARDVSREERALYTHERAASYFLFFALLYAVGFFATHPADHAANLERTPAYAFVLVLATLLCVVFSFLGYVLDVFRVPPVFALAAVALIASSLFRADYRFDVRDRVDTAQATTRRRATAKEAVEAWAATHADRTRQPVGFVVAASGGGITAACWTTSVLRKLTSDETLGRAQFGDSILALSTVSGGSVGAMNYVDAYSSAKAPPSADEVREIVLASGHSSLPFTAWGLAYPDFWRFVTGCSFSREDRGSCQEHGWAQQLRERTATLLDWQRGVLAGWRPLQIFNATIVETGERMQLMPLDVLTDDLPSDKTKLSARAVSFLDRFPHNDLDVVTAARLSATFPYVTPVARARCDEPSPDAQRHCADGGYTDNFGVLSALEYVRAVVARCPAEFQGAGARRIALIEIRASDPQNGPAGNPAASSDLDGSHAPGWAYELAGPISTMLNVRTTAQVARNDFENDLVHEIVDDHHCSFERFVFVLPCESPLSWQLSDDESRAIRQGMTVDPHADDRERAIQQRNEDALKRLRQFVAPKS